jgi:hypothetical protein
MRLFHWDEYYTEKRQLRSNGVGVPREDIQDAVHRSPSVLRAQCRAVPILRSPARSTPRLKCPRYHFTDDLERQNISCDIVAVPERRHKEVLEHVEKATDFRACSRRGPSQIRRVILPNAEFWSHWSEREQWFPSGQRDRFTGETACDNFICERCQEGARIRFPHSTTLRIRGLQFWTQRTRPQDGDSGARGSGRVAGLSLLPAQTGDSLNRHRFHMTYIV